MNITLLEEPFACYYVGKYVVLLQKQSEWYFEIGILWVTQHSSHRSSQT